MSFSCDFETTTEQDDCRVWACGIYHIDSGSFIYGKDLDYFFKFFSNPINNETIYFHNLKFDGDFIMNYLFRNGYTYERNYKYLTEKTFNILMSDKGIFYSMQICTGVHKGKKNIIKINDSLKLLPFSVSKISESFGIEKKKGEIDYKKHRPIGYDMDENEIDYLRNDCEIVGIALKKTWELNFIKMTVGGNALHSFKNFVGKKSFEYNFPCPSYDNDIRPSYRGGWVYANPLYVGKEIGDGIVLDVNSLYPSRLRDCLMPYGDPLYYEGEPIERKGYPLFIVSLWCSFTLKTDHLPTIQVKNSMYFKNTEYCTDSKGEIINLCLTNVDLDLFFDHYDVYEITWNGAYYFKGRHDLFTEFIDFYGDMKIQAEKDGNETMRTWAKLIMNNLYGKFSTNPKCVSKIPFLDTDGKINFTNDLPEYRECVYLPIGVFTTAYARDLTIRSAQKCYDRFLYADTDSLHLIGTEVPECLDIDSYRIGAWKLEMTFSKAKYLRAKTYLETNAKDGKMKITCCGMPKGCYPYVTYDNFKIGTSYDGKLMTKRVSGGIVLNDTQFTIH